MYNKHPLISQHVYGLFKYLLKVLVFFNGFVKKKKSKHLLKLRRRGVSCDLRTFLRVELCVYLSASWWGPISKDGKLRIGQFECNKCNSNEFIPTTLLGVMTRN